MRKIKVVKLYNQDFIYVNRGINNFLFTQDELSIAKIRYKEWKKTKYL